MIEDPYAWTRFSEHDGTHEITCVCRAYSSQQPRCVPSLMLHLVRQGRAHMKARAQSPAAPPAWPGYSQLVSRVMSSPKTNSDSSSWLPVDVHVLGP